mgnify:FL=1
MNTKWLRTITLFAAFAACLSLTACATSSADEPVPRLVYGLTLMPTGFDPHIHASAELGIPLRSVYDTLVFRDPDSGGFIPGLATAWTVSPDGLTYTFTLRRDVTFHDGTRFDAAAVVANFNRIFDPATNSQKAAFMVPSFQSAEIVDNYTVKITLSEPYAPLLDSLAQVYFGMASPTALAEYDVDTYQFHQVGTGPFRFVELIPADRLVIERNPDYAWAPSLYQNKGIPNVEQIEFRFFTDPTTRALALESGDAQLMGELLPTDAELLAGNTRVRIYPVPIPGQPLQFYLNTQRWPTNDITVRRALLLGANRTEIVDTVFQGYSPVAHGPLAATTEYFEPALVNAYLFDFAQARALLASIGFADVNGDGVLEFQDQPLKLDVIVPPWGLAPQVGQLLEAQWEALGADVHLVQVPSFTALKAAAAEGEYNAISLNFYGADPSLLNQFFLSGAELNWSRVESLDLDLLLAEGARVSDPERRRGIYSEVQRLIMDLALVIPIRDYVNLNGASAELQGLRFDAYGWFPILTDLGRAGAE